MTRAEKKRWKERVRILCGNYAIRLIDFVEMNDEINWDLQTAQIPEEDKCYVKGRLYDDELRRADVKRVGRAENLNAEHPMLKYHVEVRP